MTLDGKVWLMHVRSHDVQLCLSLESSFVLTYYKTEQCRRPPRLCRQGYACPFFHNNKDRRRSPKHFKYRCTCTHTHSCSTNSAAMQVYSMSKC